MGIGGRVEFKEEEQVVLSVMEVEVEFKELQGVTRKKQTATDLLVLARLFGT